jgi:hypothetical protein
VSKGRTVDSTGKIDPALMPLVTNSAANVINSQNRNPVEGFQESYQRPVAGLSDYQRYAGQQITGLSQPTAGSYLALQNIMDARGLAGRIPTVNSGRGSQTPLPSMANYRGALQPYTGQWMPGTSSGNANPTSPQHIGPAQLSPEEARARIAALTHVDHSTDQPVPPVVQS